MGAQRLDELQKRRITGFDYDNVSMAFGPDKTLLVTITPNDTPVGNWTRQGGLMVAHFAWAAPYSTRSLDEAYGHTVEMVRQFRRIRAGSTPT